jgi:hypothetical protein
MVREAMGQGQEYWGWQEGRYTAVEAAAAESLAESWESIAREMSYSVFQS